MTERLNPYGKAISNPTQAPRFPISLVRQPFAGQISEQVQGFCFDRPWKDGGSPVGPLGRSDLGANIV